MIKCSLIIFICTSLTIGCKEERKPITPEEVKDFVTNLENSINKKEPGFFDDAFDKKELWRRAGVPDKNSEQKIKLGSGIVNSFPGKTNFQLVKQYQKGETWHLIFRLYFQDNMALNYYDMELIRNNAEVKIADGYAYNMGQTFSSIFKELNKQMNEVARNAKENKDKWLDLIADMRKLVNQGKFQEALEIFETIPSDVRQIKMMQIIHVMISCGIDVKTHRTALKEYKELYPKEPNISLMAVSGYLLLQDYGQALQAINELDKQIDTDPFLDYYRAICYKMLLRPDDQTKSLVRLNNNMPGFEDGILELLAVYLRDNEYEKARLLVHDFREKDDFNQSLLTDTLSRYPDFKE